MPLEVVRENAPGVPEVVTPKGVVPDEAEG